MSGYAPIDDREWSRLAQAALDHELSTDDAARFSAEIASNAARAADFARLAMLHDALEREMNAAVAGRTLARRTRMFARIRRFAAVAAAIALATGFAWIAFRTTPEASAAEVVAKLGAPTEVVQLGRRSAYRYDATRTKSTVLFLGIVNFANQDARQDRVWLFFDDKDVLLHYGATLSTHRTQYALPWEDVHEAEDHASRDAARKESGR